MPVFTAKLSYRSLLRCVAGTAEGVNDRGGGERARSVLFTPMVYVEINVNCDFIFVFIVRLVEGPNLREGRLEVLRNGVWGGVCYEYTDTTRAVDDGAARVVCSMLGYGYAYAFDSILTLMKIFIH